VCGSMVDIQYAMAENRRGKKTARKKKKKPQEENIMSASAMHGNHKNASNMKEIEIHTRESGDSDARRPISLL